MQLKGCKLIDFQYVRLSDALASNGSMQVWHLSGHPELLRYPHIELCVYADSAERKIIITFHGTGSLA